MVVVDAVIVDRGRQSRRGKGQRALLVEEKEQ
jgi:hypothetical protein